jgi:hypothetical protein
MMMHTILIAIPTLLAILLIHFSYVDFRFRYRDGILWFWRLYPAPPMMWAGRLTIVAAVIAVLCAPLVGINRTFAYVLGGLMLLHLICLVLLEVLEPR